MNIDICPGERSAARISQNTNISSSTSTMSATAATVIEVSM